MYLRVWPIGKQVGEDGLAGSLYVDIRRQSGHCKEVKKRREDGDETAAEYMGKSAKCFLKWVIMP